jgi:disulfide oxidoreductase YuzD
MTYGTWHSVAMPDKSKKQPKWHDGIEADDFEAAESYLRLIHTNKQSARLVKALRRAKPDRFRAKDIFRASGLSRLGVSNLRVARYRKKIKQGLPLSPILLVRDEMHGKVIVADGYHRLCAVYEVNEDAWIPCRIV